MHNDFIMKACDEIRKEQEKSVNDFSTDPFSISMAEEEFEDAMKDHMRYLADSLGD